MGMVAGDRRRSMQHRMVDGDVLACICSIEFFFFAVLSRMKFVFMLISDEI